MQRRKRLGGVQTALAVAGILLTTTFTLSVPPAAELLMLVVLAVFLIDGVLAVLGLSLRD